MPKRFARCAPTSSPRRAPDRAPLAAGDQRGTRRRQEHGGRQSRCGASDEAAAACSLIDADLRRPVLHELLRLHATPGAVGRSDRRAQAERSDRRDAHVPVSGCFRAAPGSRIRPSSSVRKRFKEFLEKLTDSFDWVIIDSPPVMAVTDPAVIAHVASGVLFVVNARRTQQTDRAGRARPARDRRRVVCGRRAECRDAGPRSVLQHPLLPSVLRRVHQRQAERLRSEQRHTMRLTSRQQRTCRSPDGTPPQRATGTTRCTDAGRSPSCVRPPTHDTPEILNLIATSYDR